MTVSDHALASIGPVKNAPGQWAAVCTCGHVRVQMFRGSALTDLERHLELPERAQGAGVHPFPGWPPS